MQIFLLKIQLKIQTGMIFAEVYIRKYRGSKENAEVYA